MSDMLSDTLVWLITGLFPLVEHWKITLGLALVCLWLVFAHSQWWWAAVGFFVFTACLRSLFPKSY